MSTALTTTRDAPWFAEVPRSGLSVTIAGYLVMLLGVGGFGAWAAIAPIEGAIVSPGVFVATSQNKIIQHLEGGIIREIAVREGEAVQAGQLLVRLDDTAAKAELRRLELRKAQLTATISRLKVEAFSRQVFEVPVELQHSANTDPEIQPIIDSQKSIFVARRERLLNDIAIQEHTFASFQHRMAGDDAKRKSIKEQLVFVKDELEGKTKLHDKGLIRKPEFLALKRLEANLTGEVERLQKDVMDNQERARATRVQIERLRSVAVQAAVEEVHTATGELKDVGERLNAARSVLSRLDILAPVAGTVVKLNYHTPSGVVRPGNDILALLPIGDELVIEARVRPQDIDHVKEGLSAIVRMTTMNQRVTPMIPGKVIYVSADALPNEKRASDDNIYVARIRLEAADLATIKQNNPTPGMPVEVYIKTGERTFLHYLMQPLLDTMARAFRES
jgi:HlyD family secretion protein